MNARYIALTAALAVLLLGGPIVESDAGNGGRKKEFNYGVSLYDEGMFERAREVFGEIAARDGDIEAEGYDVLCAVRLRTTGYTSLMDNYIDNYPYISLVPQIRFYYVVNCFADGDYKEASRQLEQIEERQLYRSQRGQYLFCRAYCSYAEGNYDVAYKGFKKVISRGEANYVAPSNYFCGYILYTEKNFSDAEKYFAVSAKDPRFSEISNYYILECRFMQNDYHYVVQNGPEMMSKVPADRQQQVSRFVSESYLVLGDAHSAREYYSTPDATASPNRSGGSDEDWFYAGSVLYAVQDWAGAAENFSHIQDKTDSLGQIASYHSASCYLNLKNKVAAMESFKTASESEVNPTITEDAMYNYAKLAFDLNGDISVFERYLSIYSDKKRGDRVYAYIAVGALQNRNYAAAVEAYDKIDELDDDMKSNYMKANYLRAKELIDGGSWRAAVPCLKVAAYYSDRREGFNQLSRYWLAESYYRDGKYDDSRSGFNELYNTDALYGTVESQLLPYNVAYCYFQEGEYEQAAKWFTDYIDSGSKTLRKEALVRRGDCYFLQKDYTSSLTSYTAAFEEYPDINDIYPYYQAALAYGLTKKNDKKIETLEKVSSADPDAAFYPEATCELGVTYSRKGNDAKARECFNRIIDNTKDSTYISRALIELGTLSMKASDKDGALAYYRRVVEEMPLSHYTDDALEAMSSVYRSSNDPQGYLDYLDSIGKSYIMNEQEREEMIFSSAEQIFIAGNYGKALTALNDYLEAYPEGAKKAEAELYVAESYRNMEQYENACDYYASVMKYASGSTLELATARYSEVSYSLQHYENAYYGYERLLSEAQILSNKTAARLGMMRAAYNGRMYDEAILASAKVASDKSYSASERTEANYIEGKSYMAISNREKALPIFTQLSEDPSTAYGGEAAYIIILDCYNRGEFGEVETKVFAFSESSNPHQYWLAKSFVVLGDSYAEQGEYEQAKATFESVRDGYNPSEPDDVKDNLDLRIRKTEEMISGAGANNI